MPPRGTSNQHGNPLETPPVLIHLSARRFQGSTAVLPPACSRNAAASPGQQNTQTLTVAHISLPRSPTICNSDAAPRRRFPRSIRSTRGRGRAVCTSYKPTWHPSLNRPCESTFPTWHPSLNRPCESTFPPLVFKRGVMAERPMSKPAQQNGCFAGVLTLAFRGWFRAGFEARDDW